MASSRKSVTFTDPKQLNELIEQNPVFQLTLCYGDKIYAHVEDCCYEMKISVEDFWGNERLVGDFIAAVQKNTTISHLRFIYFTGKSQHFVANFLQDKQLTELTLEKYEIMVGGVRDTLDLSIVADHIKKNPHLITVTLGGIVTGTARFTVKDAKMFVPILLEHPNIKEFNVKYTTAMHENQMSTGEDVRDEKAENPQQNLAGWILINGILPKIAKYPHELIKTGIEDYIYKPEKEIKSEPVVFKKAVEEQIEACVKELSRFTMSYGKSAEAILGSIDYNVYNYTYTYEINEKQKKLVNDKLNERCDYPATYLVSFKNYSQKYLSLKVRNFETRGLSEYQYIKLTICGKDVAEKSIKRYFISRYAVSKFLDWFKENMPASDLEKYQQRKIRLNKMTKSSSYWSQDWDEQVDVFNKYHHVIHPMFVNVVDELFQKTSIETKEAVLEKKITVCEIGGGKGVLAVKVIENLVAKGFQVEYHFIEPSASQCEIAHKNLAEVKKKLADKVTYHVIDKVFAEADCHVIEGKVNLLIACGVFTLDVRDRLFKSSADTESKKCETDRDMSRSIELLAPSGVLIHSGATSGLYVAREYEALGLVMLRKTYRYKDFYTRTQIRQCYVGQKPALVLKDKMGFAP